MAILKEVKPFEDFKVQIVTSFPDLCFYITKNKSELNNNNGVWYFDNYSAKKQIKFVTSFPDLKIQYVTLKSAAGWKNKNDKLQNRIS